MHLLVPDTTGVEEIDRIIFAEAIYGRVRPASRNRVVDAIAGLADRGCDALILGCSEASMIMTVEDSPLPVVDPVELLAEAAVHRAVGGMAAA
jgi:aspartate racemase